MSRKFLVLMAAGLVFAGVGITVVQAQDKPAAPAPAVPAASSATGTWTWTVEGQNGKREMKLTLKQDGEKLTGAMAGRQGDTEISDGTIKNGEIAFKIVRKMNDAEMVTKYSGKLEGDVIKGKSEMERNGQVRTTEFEAKRAPADAAK